MKLMSFLFVFLNLFFCLNQVEAQNSLIEKQFIFEIDNADLAEAKKQALEKAVLQVTEDYGKDFIGEDRFNKNRSMIQTKVIKQSARYIPFSKIMSLQTKGTIQSLQVDIKFSFQNFRQILQDQGLLSQADNLPIVIPYMTWTDQIHSQVFRWWKDGKDSNSSEILLKYQKSLESIFKDQFVKNGFYVLGPVNSNLIQQIPQVFQSERLSQEDMIILGQYFQSSLSIDGTIQIQTYKKDQYQIDVRLTAFINENNKTVGDISRQIYTESGPFERVVDKKMKEIFEISAKDLSSQIFEAWQRGSLSSRTLKLVLKGHYPIKDKEEFKEKIKNQFSSIKTIKERSLQADSSVFEVETPWTVQDIVQKFQNFQFKSQIFKFSQLSENEVLVEAAVHR